jgi:hypothetical protein
MCDCETREHPGFRCGSQKCREVGCHKDETVPADLNEYKPIRYYLTLSFDDVSSDDASQIVDLVTAVRGTRMGMSVHYGSPITGEDE